MESLNESSSMSFFNYVIKSFFFSLLTYNFLLHFLHAMYSFYGLVAQLVEQRSENYMSYLKTTLNLSKHT